MTSEGVYVYAIIGADHAVPPETVGVGSPPAGLRTVREGRVAAVVSAAPTKLRARRRDLLAHQDLLMRLADDGPVLPMRFGMVAPDEATVRGQLASAGREHLAALERVSGRFEINVKALPAQDALAAVVAEDRGVRRLRDQARNRPGYEASLRLGEAVSAALTRRAAEAGRRILDELAPLARGASVGPEVQGCTLNVSFLVDGDESAGFLTMARGLAEAHRDRVDLRLAGPLPCYSFVTPEGRPATTAGV